jgi:hypothetical protein
MESYMKFSRILIVGLLIASCSDGASTDQQALTSESQATEPQAGTTGERRASEAPAPKTPASAPTPIADQAKAVGVNPDAAVLQDFKARVDAYMKLRKEAVKGAPKLKETNDPAQIKGSQDAMSAQIRAARMNAKHGDVLTPEMAAAFRRALYPELKGDDGRDAKHTIEDDAPTNITFKVNAKYPEGASLPSVPANLLMKLPTLPEPLQYRIVEKHLILLDEDADVIVDYALNIIR